MDTPQQMIDTLFTLYLFEKPSVKQRKLDLFASKCTMIFIPYTPATGTRKKKTLNFFFLPWKGYNSMKRLETNKKIRTTIYVLLTQ